MPDTRTKFDLNPHLITTAILTHICIAHVDPYYPCFAHHPVCRAKRTANTPQFTLEIFLKPSTSTCSGHQRRDRVGEASLISQQMKDFTEDIRMQEFLQWSQQQRNQAHENDQAERQQQIRKSNAEEISNEAAALRQITTAKA
jgi:hypothetical protein